MTRKEKRWIETIKEQVGCLACYQDSGILGTPADAHHLIDGGRRIGHLHTVPLCAWHHRGHRPEDCRTDGEAEAVHGPALSRNSKAFHERYGDDTHLLWLARSLARRFEQNTIGGVT